MESKMQPATAAAILCALATVVLAVVWAITAAPLLGRLTAVGAITTAVTAIFAVAFWVAKVVRDAD